MKKMQKNLKNNFLDFFCCSLRTTKKYYIHPGYSMLNIAIFLIPEYN